MNIRRCFSAETAYQAIGLEGDSAIYVYLYYTATNKDSTVIDSEICFAFDTKGNFSSANNALDLVLSIFGKSYTEEEAEEIILNQLNAMKTRGDLYSIFRTEAQLTEQALFYLYINAMLKSSATRIDENRLK